MNIAELRETWLGRQFDRAEFEVEAKEMLDWAEACGETDARFTDSTHPDFQAHPGFTAKYASRRTLPTDFPQLGDGRGVDGGKCVESLGPIRPGDVLGATILIADIYEKTGRSGTMVFIVHRMRYENQRGEPVSVVDWRMIRNVG